MKEEQRRARSGESRLIAGNFSQADIDVRASLRAGIKHSAAVLKIRLPSGALSGDDGPPIQQRPTFQVSTTLQRSDSHATQLEQVTIRHDSATSTPTFTRYPRLLLDLERFKREGYPAGTAQNHEDSPEAARQATTAVVMIDLTEDKAANTVAGATTTNSDDLTDEAAAMILLQMSRPASGGAGATAASEERGSYPDSTQGSTTESSSSTQLLTKARAPNGAEATQALSAGDAGDVTGIRQRNEEALVAEMADRLSCLQEDGKLVLLQAAFPSMDIARIGRHLGNCYGDFTKTWAAINAERHHTTHNILLLNLAMRAKINKNHEPAFPFLNCLDSPLSPASPRLLPYVVTATAAVLKQIRLFEMVDNEWDAAEANTKLQRLGKGEIIALFMFAFPQHHRQVHARFSLYVQSAGTDFHGIWIQLERFGCQQGFRRPPFRFSEVFTCPQSPLYEAPLMMFHSRNIDYADGLPKILPGRGEVAIEDPVRALGGVVRRVSILGFVPAQPNTSAIPGPAPRTHDILVCQREHCTQCGGVDDASSRDLLQGIPFVHVGRRRSLAGVMVPEDVLIFAPQTTQRRFTGIVPKDLVDARVKFLTTGTRWVKMCVGKNCAECSAAEGGAGRE